MHASNSRSTVRFLIHTFVRSVSCGVLALACTGAALAQSAAVPGTPAPAASPTPAVPVSPGALEKLVRVADGRLLAPDIARIVNRGELVVAMLNVNTPPFFYEKDGEWVGLEVDLARAMAADLGVKVRFNRSAANFNSVVDALARGEADVAISKLSRTLARTQLIAFSQPYLGLKHSLMLNRVKFAQLTRDRQLTDVVRQLDSTVGVIAKSSFAYYARRNFPKARIVEYPTWEAVLAALYKGEVVSAYRDEFEVKRVLKLDPTASLTLRTVTFKDLEDTLGIGVSIADPTLLAFVNAFLDQRTEKLDIAKVLQAVER